MKRLRQISKNRIFKNNRGTTLIEMIVCFALMGIFIAAAAAIIASITALYYNIKGEIYSREVSDIVLEKVASELDGAEYFKTAFMGGVNPQIIDNESIELFDKTDTYVNIGLDENKGIYVYYHGINATEDKDRRNNTYWYFDEKMYNGFNITDMKFYGCGEATTDINFGSSVEASTYGLSGVNLEDYDGNVVLVLLQLHSGRYGDYTYYRFVRMYNVPSDYQWPEEFEDDTDDNT